VQINYKKENNSGSFSDSVKSKYWQEIRHITGVLI
jgi:hypothetical protein